MTSPLTDAGYLQTREKLAQMEERLAALQRRADLHPSHRAAAERSYRDMIRQYRRDLKLYEATYPDPVSPTDAETQHRESHPAVREGSSGEGKSAG
jgi:hypothetical protein